MRGTTSLESLLQVLRDYRGYFTMLDESGEEVIIGYKKDVLPTHAPEKQLTLQDSAPAKAPLPSADAMLEKINRDIALFRDLQVEQEFDDLAIDADAEEGQDEETKVTLPPPRRVRFEPIRGDLPPELQE